MSGFTVGDDGAIVLGFDNILLPEGEYWMHVASAALKKKKDAGPDDFPYIEWQYALESAVDGRDIGDWAGKNVQDIASLNPTARWKLKEIVEALLQKQVDDKDFRFVPSDYIGMNAIVVVEHSTYKGRVQAKASRIYHPDFAATAADATNAVDPWKEFETTTSLPDPENP